MYRSDVLSPQRHDQNHHRYDTGFTTPEIGLVFRNDGEPFCVVVRVTGTFFARNA